MTKHLTTKNLMDWPFVSNSIGFENLLDNLHRTAHVTGTYPPYNIVKVDDVTHRIELALAGFTSDDITITHEENILTIKGEIATSVTDGGEDYVHKGISSKGFERSFTLGEYIQISGAKMENGMLNITCETIVPDEKQPKTIKIS